MIFDFLLQMHPTVLILLIGIFVSVIMVFAYKYMTDQSLMKQLKSEIKELQTEMKELRNNPTRMSEVNKRAMETNMKYMMHSMKPTLVTFIPVILIFGWLNSHIAYNPLIVGEEFSVELEFYDGMTGKIIPSFPEGITLINGEEYVIKDNKIRLVYKGEVAGEYTLQYALQNDAGEILKTWENKVIITAKGSRKYAGPIFTIKDDILKTIKVSNEKFHPFGTFQLFGWYPGWIALYIIISLVCSLSLRKWLNIY